MKYINEKYLNPDLFKQKYAGNDPFPHIVFDNFIDKNLIENIFNQLYELKEKTIFIVSHRLAFLKKCDVILEFSNGKIINKGSYEKLLKDSDSFRELSKNVR